jgi:hypothetical protein
MSANDTIIDVNPVEYSSSRIDSGASDRAHAHSSSQSSYYHQPAWKTASYYRGIPVGTDRQQYGYGSAYTRFDGQAASTKPAGSFFGALSQVVVGVGMVLIGIPLLFLPGPGLLSIFGGIALASTGMRKLRRWSQACR